MFEQENSLPGPKLHFPINNWHRLARTRHYHADVRGHIVRAFVVMLEIIGVFRHEPVEKLFEIAARGWRRIFHRDGTATSVRSETGNRPAAHTRLVCPIL